jgi:hypothetical protein
MSLSLVLGDAGFTPEYVDRREVKAAVWPCHIGGFVKHVEHNGRRHRTDMEERDIREAALDRTIEASFPASDPPSTIPNPGAHDALDERMPSDGDADHKH